ISGSFSTKIFNVFSTFRIKSDPGKENPVTQSSGGQWETSKFSGPPPNVYQTFITIVSFRIISDLLCYFGLIATKGLTIQNTRKRARSIPFIPRHQFSTFSQSHHAFGEILSALTPVKIGRDTEPFDRNTGLKTKHEIIDHIANFPAFRLQLKKPVIIHQGPILIRPFLHAQDIISPDIADFSTHLCFTIRVESGPKPEGRYSIRKRHQLAAIFGKNQIKIPAHIPGFYRNRIQFH